MPQRFRVEPMDMGAFDRWQDREGLADASPDARAAWASWSRQSGWRKLRDQDTKPAPLGPYKREWLSGLDAWELAGMRKARAVGARHGLCNADQRKGSVPASDLVPWRRWRSRVIRSDPDVWWAVWPLLDGEPLAIVADWHSTEPERLGRAVRLAFRWLALELYRERVRQKGVRV